MADIVLKQCHFCEEWFAPNLVRELELLKGPNSSYEHVFACESCLKLTRVERLAARASKAMDLGGFNEIEVTEGDLKVRLVRFTPVPYYPHPLQFQYYDPNPFR